MTTEITVLALAAMLQAVQYFLFAIPANIELGVGYTSSARDRPPSRQLSDRTARLQRAMTNHFEALILFTIAVTVTTLGNQTSGFTAACAWIYLAARILYVPAYAYGWRPWRSAIWAVGFFSTILMILSTLI